MDPASSLPIPTRPAAELINTIDPPSPCLTIGRFATSTVLWTPVRLTSMTSRQPSAPASIGAMPALATTMSSRPNSSSPACSAVGQRRLIANVGLLRHDSRTGVLDELDRGGQIVGGGHRVGDRGDLVADVDRDDVGAVGRQPDRLRAALTASRAGDERDLACERRSIDGAQLALGRVARDDGLQHLDVRGAVEMLADRAEQRRDRGCGAVRLQRVGVGPLLDENERAVGLVQRVEVAAGLGVHRLDGLLTRISDGVHRLGLGFHGGDDGDGHGRWTPR